MSAYFFGWFETSIRAAQKTPGCEFGILILTLPLLERYLRETSGVHEGALNERFYDDMLVVIPDLGMLVRYGAKLPISHARNQGFYRDGSRFSIPGAAIAFK